MSHQALYIGVMSGSSLDGIDVALTDLSDQKCSVISTHFQAYSDALKNDLLALHFPSENELEQSALMANQLACQYADSINALLKKNNLEANQITAIGCHGQTIRHQPQYQGHLGYSIQLGNHALLAELTDITVIGDFRTRDIAAGGQGAPLVPAFHQAVFSNPNKNRAIINIGGIANISYLNKHGKIIGFDSGPGNILLDYWIKHSLNQSYDKDGLWASTGQVNHQLLTQWLAEPYFELTPPKSTGRDLFNATWLNQHVAGADYPSEDIARTLVELTSQSIYKAIQQHCPEIDEVYICGGGAHNQLLMTSLKNQLGQVSLSTTNALGVDVDWVEAAAFSWLAQQTMQNTPSNLPAATGAAGARILGAIYPA
jgi:anhydro-N-acetylmuramic acid kinase